MAGLIGLLPGAPADIPGIPFTDEDAAHDAGLALVLGVFDGRLALRAPGGREAPLAVDFVGGRQGYRLAADRVRHERLVKAVGPPAAEDAEVIDLTAGLGRDALVLAQAGFRVTLLERSPVIHALLADGLCRLAQQAPQVAARLTLCRADARTWLAETGRCVQGILIDPMFPERGKSAAVKKELQWLQHLADAPDAEEEAALLAMARRHALKRVVVKRPLRAPPLAGEKPAHSLTGKTVRFDVYLPC